MMNKNRKYKYEIVIILCPSESETFVNKYAYYEIEEDKKEKGQFLYLGGQIRMQAAVDIATQVKKFIVIGGSKAKVDDMKNYLEQEFKDKKIGNTPQIIRIESEPDTTGNLWALKKVLKPFFDENNKRRNKKAKKIEVCILTNFYHLLRTMRFASDIFKNECIYFIPIAAEALITKREPTYPFYVKEFLLRISREINGLRAWENGEYNKQDKPEKEWKSECYDQEILQSLLNELTKRKNK